MSSSLIKNAMYNVPKLIMKKFKNKDVEKVFNNYPPGMRGKLMLLRKLVLETAAETESVTSLQETLKWGEPSYLTKGGSTIRIDWKNQNQINMLCTLIVNLS